MLEGQHVREIEPAQGVSNKGICLTLENCSCNCERFEKEISQGEKAACVDFCPDGSL